MENCSQLAGSTRLKLKIKKRNSFSGHTLKSRANGQPLCPLSNISNGRNRPRDSSQAKRKNPFQCQKEGSKRLKSDGDDMEDKENDFSHFKVTKDKKNSYIRPTSYEGILESSGVNKQDEPFESTHGKSSFSNNEKKPSQESRGEFFPMDWSLKAKVKFTSERQFSWCTNLKSSQVSKAVGNFVRCAHENGLSDTAGTQDDFGVEFRKNLLYWKHPCLPNIPSFPISEKSLSEAENSSHFFNICKDSAIQTEIMKQWAHSFQSLFTITKCGFCPYFYMCCQKFVTLFIGHGVLCEGMVAVVSPTTKGFRDLLQKEGIEFSMPHVNNAAQEKEDTLDDFEDDNECDDHDDDFLTSIGLNKKNFSSIEKQTIVEELSKLSSIDNRSQSTVLIEDCHLNALFNFFVNSDIIVAQSGNWQGVPPTLHSPVAFEGATLQNLKCIQGPMKINGKDGMKQVYGLEVSGTLLPTQLYNILQLAKSSNTSYEASLSTHMHSSAFNIIPAMQQENSTNDDPPRFGINKQCLDHLRRSPSMNNEGLASLKFCDNEFEWKTNAY